MEDEGEDEMPKANDRKRAKDTIIEGIAKAVKHIQSHQLSQLSEDQGVVLRNSDWQFHKLVENLDHAFLYGLRHFSSGYWIVVQEFTHKSTIEDILKLSNVITNLGRSRAWLYRALSDHLLESYINCFIKNAELVRKHYVKEALVLDEQRLELLLTLSSGLELIAFDLEANVQYLDLCSCVKFRTENQEEEADDDISLCSMISLQSQNSLSDETNRLRITVSPLSLLSNLMKPLSFKLQPTSTLTLEETEEEKKMRIENFANTEVIPANLPGDDETNQSRSIISPLSLFSNLMKPLSSKLQPTSPLTLEETEEEKKTRIENFANAEVVPAVTLEDEEKNQSRSAISPLSLLSNLIKPLSFKLHPTSLNSEAEEEEKKIQTETLARTEVVPPEPPEDDAIEDADVNGEVEVIRVRPKRLHARKIDRIQKSPSAPDSDNSSLVSVESSACLPLSPINSESSRSQAVPVEDSNCASSANGHSNALSSNVDGSGDTVIKKNDEVLDVQSSDELTDETKNSAEDELSQDEKLFRILGDNFDAAPGEKVGEDSAVERNSFTECSTEQKNDPPVNAVDFESTSSPSTIPEQSHVDVDKHHDEILASEEGELDVEAVLVASVEELSIYDDAQCTTAAVGCSEVASSVENHNGASSDVNALPPSVESSSEAKSPSLDLSLSSVPISESNESLEMSAAELQAQADCFAKMSRHPSEIEVDNNLKVVLMLEVFLHEDEELFKMFRTCQGHTEGEVVVTYVLMTSHYLYLLRPSNRPNKFTRDAAITYKELDYISISLNWQILHIVCLARHNQFWITTGDESLTRILVSHLTHAVYMSSSVSMQGSSSPSLTVLEDATAQKISIAKLVSEEIGVTREEVSLLNYSLVHWEDSEAIRGGDLRLSHSHRGVLFYKKTSTTSLVFTSTSWHRGYFVLEQGVLHQYPDKNCSGMPERTVSFTPDQCLGCRRCPLATDRKHVFEILLPREPSLELSAPSEAELREWLVRLCQATCDQSNPRASVFGCVACCSVVTQSHVFVCHEDLQTNFLRSLACLALSSLSEIQTDSNAPMYCVLVSKLPVKKLHNEEKWCVYFKSVSEQERFISAILDACTRSKQSTLRMERVDTVMSARCQTGIAKLNKLHEMGAV